MKKILFLLVALSCLVSVHATLPENWAYISESITTDIKISSEIDVLRDKTGADIDYIEAELAFVPLKTWRQDILSLDTTPTAIPKDNTLNYRWNDPELDSTLLYQVRSRMEVDYGLRRVTKKIPFPLNPDDLQGMDEYLQFTENIDVNGEIKQLANTLKDGEDDLYHVVYKVSQWMKNNINYNLSFAETLEKPTQVLESRQGVCDEFTALMVSILRSIGIPTKYVSGYAYTNLRTPADFGPHAWAEVYFPGVGWVPFDITYNQFGFVDASHIKLQESFDSGSYSSRYEWRGRDVSLRTKNLEFTADVIDVGDTIDSRVTIEAQFLKDSVGFGSYNLIEVTVTNLNNFYQGVTVYTTQSNEMEYIGGNTRDILLEPYESETFYLTVKLSEELLPQFSYTIPVRVYLLDGVGEEISFMSTSKNNVYSLEEMEILKGTSEVQSEEDYTSTLKIECEKDVADVYIKKPFLISCAITNKGKEDIENIEVCHNSNCKSIASLSPNDIVTQSFDITVTAVGEQEIIMVAKNQKMSEISEVTFFSSDPPKLAVDLVQHPTEVQFDEGFKIDFLIKKESQAEMKDVVVQLQREDFAKQWDIPLLTVDRRFLIDLKGHDLQNGINNFEITISYLNENSEEQIIEEDFSIELVNTTLSQRIWLKTENIGQGLSAFDLKVFVIFAFAFGGLLGFLLHAYPKIKYLVNKKIRAKKELEHIEESNDSSHDDTEMDDQDDEEVADMEIEEAVTEVLEENERLQQQVEELERQKKELAQEMAQKTSKSWFASIFSKKKLAKPKHKESPKKELKPPEKKVSLDNIGEKLEKNIKDGFEKVKNESEKLKKKGEMP